MDELMGFIGLVFAMGITCLPSYRDYWSTDPIFSNVWFRSVMSRDRFCEIKHYIHIVDNSLASPSNNDRLWKVRPLIELLQEKCSSLYSPHPQLAVDESMIGTKCRLSFLQYLPKKPVKWGIKVWVCSDSVNGYIVTFDVYTGADPSVPSYPKGLCHHVVTKLLTPFFDKGYTLFMDNYYTSPTLFKDLLCKFVAAVGTARTNRKNFPKFETPTTKPPRGTCSFLYHKEIVAVRWLDNRDIFCLSTAVGDSVTKVNRREGTEVIEVDCPEIIEEYNAFMGGVDVADQYMSYYGAGRKSMKWW